MNRAWHDVEPPPPFARAAPVFGELRRIWFAAETTRCASCRGTAQVRLDDRTGVPFCLECLDRAHDDQLEIGVVD